VSRTARRAWTWGGGLAAAALLAWGGATAVSYVAYEDETVVTDVARDRVESVDVRGEGNVEVVGGLTTGPIQVTARLRHGLRGPAFRVRVEGAQLVVRGECPEVLGGRCSASIRVWVPSGVDVTAHSDHGTLSVRALDGIVFAGSEHGDVVADDLAGNVLLQSEHGNVMAGRLSGQGVAAASDHGDVEVSLARPAAFVEAESDHGDVLVVVPRGPGSYRVNARSDHGTARADVRVDPAGRRAIEAHSGHGDVLVRYP
jgi:hypothetical protein